AEEEAIALAHEFRPGPPDVGGREARSRGSLDQQPIILGVDVPLRNVQRPPAKERAASVLTGSTSNGSTTSEDTSGPETPGDSSSGDEGKNQDRRYVFIPKEGVEIPLTYDEPRTPIHVQHSQPHAQPATERGRKNMLKVDTDLSRTKSSHDVPVRLERERSPYRSTPQAKEVRTSGEFLLSPDIMSPKIRHSETPTQPKSTQQSAPKPDVERSTMDHDQALRRPSRPPISRHASAMAHPGHGPPTPKTSEHDPTRHESSSHRFRDTTRLEPDTVGSPRRSSAVPVEHYSLREAPSKHHTRQTSVPRPRTFSGSTDKPPTQSPGLPSYAAHQSLNAMLSSPLTDRRRASPRNSPRASPQASPTASPLTSPPRTPPAETGNRKSSYLESTRTSQSSSRPSSPLQPPHAPRTLGHKDQEEDHYMRPRPAMRSRQTSPLPSAETRYLEPDAAPLINIRSPSPGGRRRSSSHLGDDYRSRSQHRAPSVAPQATESQTQTLRPGALEQRRRSSSFVHNRPSLTTDSSRAEQKGDISDSRHLSLKSPTTTRAASVGAAPAALPPCPRSEPVSGYHDWYTLRENSTFKICPSCREAVTEAGYGRHLVTAFTKPPDRPVQCSFSIPFNRMAYLLMIKKRRSDIDILYDMADIAEDTLPCTGKRPSSRDWYRINEIDSDRSVSGFYACPYCVQSLETIFPILKGNVFHKSRSSRHSTEERACDLRADSSRFTAYVDLLEDTANQAMEYRRAPNVYRFVELAKSMGAVPPCSRDDLLRGKLWPPLPTLPELTICSECYEDAVWPKVLHGSSLAGQVQRRPQLVGKAQEGLSCQMYSERMRKVFSEACHDGDAGFEHLRRAALRRYRVERELQRRIVDAQRLSREEREQEMEDIVDEWQDNNQWCYSEGGNTTSCCDDRNVVMFRNPSDFKVASIYNGSAIASGFTLSQIKAPTSISTTAGSSATGTNGIVCPTTPSDHSNSTCPASTPQEDSKATKVGVGVGVGVGVPLLAAFAATLFLWSREKKRNRGYQQQAAVAGQQFPWVKPEGGYKAGYGSPRRVDHLHAPDLENPAGKELKKGPWTGSHLTLRDALRILRLLRLQPFRDFKLRLSCDRIGKPYDVAMQHPISTPWAVLGNTPCVDSGLDDITGYKFDEIARGERNGKNTRQQSYRGMKPSRIWRLLQANRRAREAKLSTMFKSFTRLAALAAVIVPQVLAVGPTDSYTDADPAQSGYLPNHNMDPAVVDSSEFGLLWSTKYNALEQFYAKPLVYTPAGGTQIVFIASSQNWIRTMNAKTGAPINARQVHTPFLQAEIGCTDIPNTIGIIGTPTIDPATDIAYFFAKTYIPNFRTAGNTGVFNGVYYFHGVNVNTLEDVFPPILIDGSQSDNAPEKYFIGGVILQRPSLTQIGSVVYGGFGGHCDLFNYTGLVVGVDVNQKKVVTNFAVESGPLVPQTNVWNQNGGGGEGGIWMSGMALATDGANRLFWVSGNGVGHENQGVPASGSSGCKTLGEAAVNLAVGDGGKLSLTDYFQPYDYQGMDGGDQDFGSGGVALLDPATFKGTGVSKIAVTSGKNGKIYILNANNLGGYKLGPGQTDGIIQTIVTNKAVFGGVGSYPLEGGFIYSTPVGYPTYVYKLGFSGAGVPVFSQVGHTPEASAGRVGVGIPVVTTNQGKAGTAILWMCDPDAGLRAWYAVPGSDGLLKRINIPQVNGLNKFQRPAFGDSRLYVTDAQGTLYCLGSPVNLPLNCTSPVQFGSVALGSSATQTVSCTANIAITQISSVTVGDAHFEVSLSDLPTGAIAKGAQFTFPVKWNLETTTVSNAVNASYGNTAPGIKSTALTIQTVNGVDGYSNKFPISLTGTEVSQQPFLSLAPISVDYGGVVITDPANIDGIDSPFVISNAGVAPLTILGYAYTDDELDDNPVYTNVTFDTAPYKLGDGFSSSNLPAVGTVVPGGGEISVDSHFQPTDVGTYNSYFFVFSDGGKAFSILEGSASTAPIANFSISTSEGGWLPASNLVMDFGKVAPGSTSSLQIRICNQGGSVLQISKSKPPNGVFRPDDPNALHESQDISVNDCAYATVLFVTNAEQPNTPDQTFTNTWTLNTDDITFGVHEVEITGTVVSRKIGPTNSTGQSVYNYLGCYHEIKPGGRLLTYQQYADNQNTNDRCQTVCANGKYAFSGTEYQTECYCGNVPPPNLYKSDETLCNYACSGDGSETCGGLQVGTGGFISIYYDPTKFTPSLNDTDTTSPVSGAPVTVKQSGNYNYIGCYSEATQGRALSDKAPAVPEAGQTIETCEASCQGYQYFGVEFANECYCGNTINAGSVAQASDDVDTNGCSMLCGGDQTEYCGGADRIEMYQLNASLPVPSGTPTTPTTPGGPTNVPSIGAYNYLGCYTEGTNGRALTGKLNPVGGATLTNELCAAACQGYTYFGTEYSGECYCGNTLLNGATLATGGTDPTANGCSMTCNGNATEYCGGAGRLSTYQMNSTSTTTGTASGTATPTTPAGPAIKNAIGAWSYNGCYTEGTNGRALGDLQNPVAGATLTLEKCAAACTGYTYFGTEYSGECYCGNTFGTGAVLATGGDDPAQNGCSMFCNGDQLEYCGGPNRLSTYKVNSTAVTSSSTTATGTSAAGTPTSATSSSTPTPTGPITVQSLAGYSYLGCYSEGTNIRALSDLQNPITGAKVSVEACSTACSQYTYFGVEYSGECYCGNTINTGSAIVAGTTEAATGCNMVCSGNATEYCGGGGRLNMYQKAAGQTTSSSSSSTISGSSSVSATSTSTSATPTPTGPSAVQTVGNYTFQGCYSEATGQRALTGAAFYSSAAKPMTIELCASSCAPYAWFGVEYGSECYCGNSPNTGSAKVALTDCSFLCPGNATEYCGAGDRLQMYQYNATVANSRVAALALSGSSSTSSSSLTSSSQTTSKTSSSSTFKHHIKVFDDNNKLTDFNHEFLELDVLVNNIVVIEFHQLFFVFHLHVVDLDIIVHVFHRVFHIDIHVQIINFISNIHLDHFLVFHNVFQILHHHFLIHDLFLITSTSTTSSQTYLPTAGALFNNWAYLGCANETTPRALNAASFTNTTGMTLSACQSFCSSSTNNYALAGLENGQECYCGNGLQNYAAVGYTGCSKPCTGNKTEICGGSSRISVWNLTTYVPPTTVKQVGTYVSQGCYPEPAKGRLLTGSSYTNKTGMTVESCVNYCSAAGANYAGLEYASQCYCGNSLATGATKAADQSSCNMLCTGNNKEFCGAGSLLNVYLNTPGSVSSDGTAKSVNTNNAATVTPAKAKARRHVRFARGVLAGKK
ncbi:MAG: hypothetical protein Q9218_005568, partial [Villophora microphyllina]